MAAVTVALDIEEIQCSTCGTWYGLEARYRKTRRRDHETFYCPNGHGQHYPQESEEERLRRLLREERDRSSSLIARIDQAEKSRSALKGQVTKLRKRAIAGVCAFCHRHFANVERHVATKHASETAEVSET